MKLTVHRGSKQIGGSCVELRSSDGTRIILDVGMPLSKPDGSDWPRGTMTRPTAELRSEGVLPDIEGLYADSKPAVSALILSHAHLDHYGLANHVHPDIPVYGSRGTIAMLQASKLFIPDATLPADLRELPSNSAITVKSFSVKGIPVDHAAPDSRALLIEADSQRLLYSGDLRAHGRQRHLFEELPESAGKIDVLILEGTTVGQPIGSHGFASEADVEQQLADFLKKHDEFVAVIASGQNIDRAISVYRAALATGRELVIDPYQAYILMTLKEICPEVPQFDSPSVRVKFIASHVARLKAAGLWALACQMSRSGKVSAAQMAANPDKFVYLARSSGATLAILRYMAKTKRPAVVWSQWSGYLKKCGPIQRFCAESGITPIVIHSGGHAHTTDLAALTNRIRPRIVVPIHTEVASAFRSFIPNVQEINDGEPEEIAALIDRRNL